MRYLDSFRDYPAVSETEAAASQALLMDLFSVGSYSHVRGETVGTDATRVPRGIEGIRLPIRCSASGACAWHRAWQYPRKRCRPLGKRCRFTSSHQHRESVGDRLPWVCGYCGSIAGKERRAELEKLTSSKVTKKILLDFDLSQSTRDQVQDILAHFLDRLSCVNECKFSCLCQLQVFFSDSFLKFQLL